MCVCVCVCVHRTYHVTLFQEYCNCGSLRGFVNQKDEGGQGPLVYTVATHAVKFTRQMMKTVAYLHSRAIPVIHLDIKPGSSSCSSMLLCMSLYIYTDRRGRLRRVYIYVHSMRSNSLRTGVDRSI